MKKMKLVLNRETLRELTIRSMKEVHGGASMPSCVVTCDSCPPGASVTCDPDTNTKKSFCVDCEI